MSAATLKRWGLFLLPYWLILAFWLAVSWGPARAETIPAQGGTTAPSAITCTLPAGSNYGGALAWATLEACRAYHKSQNVHLTWCSLPDGPDGVWEGKRYISYGRSGAHANCLPNYDIWYGFYASAGTCPTGTTFNVADGLCHGGSPSCPEAYPEYELVQQGESWVCTREDCPPAGTSIPGVSGIEYFGSGQAGSYLCLGRCRYQSTSSVSTSGAQAAYVAMAGATTGEFCSSADDVARPLVELPSEEVTPASCLAQNKGYMAINGVAQCVAAGTPGSTPVTVTGLPAASETVTYDGQGNPTGGSGGTTTTGRSWSFNGDGTITETTTTTNPDGTSSVSTNTQAVNDFCREQPQHSACKAAAWGGGCDGGFTCDGDAVQCAIARELAERRCRELYDENDATAAAQAALAELAAGDPASPEGRVSVGLPASLDDSGFLGGSCPQDVQFQVAGATVVLPFGELCGPMTWVGYLFVALSLMVGMRVVAGAQIV